jgi:enoyl-CoA hydratase/carnithine racemase
MRTTTAAPATEQPSPHVLRSLEEGVLTLTLDRPDNGNALTVAMSCAVAEALEAAATDAGVRCVVLRSSGEHVKDMRDGRDLMAGTVTDIHARLAAALHRVTWALHRVPVPTIAEVNGSAIGAGCDLALMCDLRVAGERAVFAESFLRLGLVSGIGGAWFLNRVVGPAKAMELTLTSEFIDAARALGLGLVNRVVADDELTDRTRALAASIAEKPPMATRMAKRLVRESAAVPLSAALEIAGGLQALLLSGDEHKQVVQDFLARRSSS